MKKLISVLAIVNILVLCNELNAQLKIGPFSDPLPSWNDTETKKAIIDYVDQVTSKGNDNYIEEADRIAVFDNDGTLWPENPLYFQLLFAIDRVKQQSSMHPEWKNEQPFKAVLEDDKHELLKHGEEGLLKIVMATHAGMTTKEFEKAVQDWINEARHPGFKKRYTELVYQPMLELLDYLRDNDFRTFIVSGGGIEFMRAWVEEVYKIPKENVVGSSIKTEFVIEEGLPVIRRLAELDFIDDKEGKPVGINKFIGRKPVFCAGNSDGDLAMMQWTASNEHKPFLLYVHHTDGEREWAYDRDSHIGRLAKGLDEALEKGWTIVNMKEDWKIIYSFDK